MKKERLEISRREIVEMPSDPLIARVTQLPDCYLTQIIFKANELGLKGRKLVEITTVQDSLTAPGSLFIDFITEAVAGPQDDPSALPTVSTM